MTTTARPRRWRMVGWALIALLIGLGGYVAGRATMSPGASITTTGSTRVTAQVREATLGRSLALNTTVRRAREPLAANLLTGVVTRGPTPGTVQAGDILYAVDGVGVRAIPGETTFYRALDQGARGADVRALQAWLASMGYAPSAQGLFDAATEAAVRAWQNASGLAETGVLLRGELMAVPALPGELTFDTQVLRAGAVIAEGEPVVFTMAPVPAFLLELGAEQARLVKPGVRVSITSGGHHWSALTGESKSDDQGQFTIALNPAEGTSVCGDECGSLPPMPEVYLPSSLELVPPVTGPAVPVSAIATQPDGSTTVEVVVATGLDTRRVQVLGSQDGMAVVSGLQVGEQVVVSEPPAPSPTRR